MRSQRVSSAVGTASKESLKTCTTNDRTLNLPPLIPDFLELKYHENEDNKEHAIQDGCIYPFAASSLLQATIISAYQLTCGEDVKKVVDICLNIQTSDTEFHPGDTIGLIPQNPRYEVEKILKHLKVLDRADTTVSVSVKTGTLKKKACVPLHIPLKTSLRHIFQSCLDIRAVPKKTFLRMLAIHTEIPSEQRRLEELCSKEGSDQYLQYVVEARTTFLDLLETFPSCCPPVESLLEHLPRLQARPYSIASNPVLKANGSIELHIVYTLLEFPASVCGEPQYGICTGWLDSLTRQIQTIRCNSDPLSEELMKLTLQSTSLELKVPMYLRQSTNFRLPENPSLPLILIGPGTGVAPFIGFLQHRLAKRKKSSDAVAGEIWLFFGCRYGERDFIFRSELEKYIEERILTRLFVSYSRSREEKQTSKYVQDNIKLHGEEFVKQVCEKNAIIFVCGDAKNMGKDVYDTIVTELQNQKGISEEEARQLVSELQSQGRYIQDIWV